MHVDKQFTQWEHHTFGAGYGTGEMFIFPVLKQFFDCLEDGRTYDHEVLESTLGQAQAWFMINALEKVEAIEWGTSARYGWLTKKGETVKAYVENKTPEQLYDVVMKLDERICECRGDMHSECAINPMLF